MSILNYAALKLGGDEPFLREYPTMNLYRTILALVVACLAMSFSIGAATAQTMSIDPKIANDKLAKKAFYACPKCHLATMQKGQCPTCKGAMTAIDGMPGYACEHCHVASKMGGKCPKCNKLMKVMVHTYACEGCKTSSSKAGKCPKCKKALKEMFLKFVPGGAPGKTKG